jgi:hypothetical protein
MSGNAIPGSDYILSGRQVTIPAGQTSAIVTLNALEDGSSAGELQTATMTLQPGINYSIGRPGSATLTILEE